MGRNKPFTLDDLRSSKVAAINSHVLEEKQKGKKRSKYLNLKVEIDGRTFDSKKEARRYIELRALQTAGEITHLHCQVAFELSVCKYIADFTYTRNGQLVVEDVKSAYTRKLQVYRQKKKMMKLELNIEIQEV